MCFGQAIVIFLQNTCSEAFRKKTSVIEVTSTEFLRIKELCLRQVSIRSVCLEKRLTLSWCLLYIFRQKLGYMAIYFIINAVLVYPDQDYYSLLPKVSC